MRSLPVVMSDVFAKNAAEVALVEHDQPVERLVADGFNHALAVGVRPRSPVGSEGDLRALATEDLIAVVDELGVAVVDEEAHRPLELTQLPTLVSGLLGDPGRVGMGGAVEIEDARSQGSVAR